MDEKSILHEIDIQLRTVLNYILALHDMTVSQLEAIQKIKEAQELFQKGYKDGKENT